MIHKAIEIDDPIIRFKNIFKLKYEIECDIPEGCDTWISIALPIVTSLCDMVKT
jgi:hypothetical protein